MNKGIKNDKTMIIAVVVVFIICIIGSFFLISKNMNLSNKEIPKTETEDKLQQVIDEQLTEEEKENLTEEEQGWLVWGDEMAKYEESLKIGEETNKEFSKEQNATFYKSLLKRAETADYISILNEIEEKSKEYKFHEDYNWNIGNVYHDATIMKESINVPVEGKGYMVKNLKDPAMLLIGTLMIPEESRRVIICNPDSLSPIFDGAVNIKKHEIVPESLEYEDEYMNTIAEETFSLANIHKFNFEVEFNPLVAYIVEHHDGSLEFITIKQDGDYKCHYKPISYWIGLDFSLNNNSSLQEKPSNTQSDIQNNNENTIDMNTPSVENPIQENLE